MRAWVFLVTLAALFVAGIAFLPELSSAVRGGQSPQELPFLLLLTFSFVGGLAAFFNPCSFATFPVFVSMVLASEPKRSAWALGASAALGLSVFYGLAFILLASLGTWLASWLIQTRLLAGVLFSILGIMLLFNFHFFFQVRPQAPKVEGLGGFFSMGFFYGLAGAFCTTPILLTLFVLPLATGPSTVLTSFAVFLLASAFLMVASTYLAVRSRHSLKDLGASAGVFRKAAGIILLLASLYMFLPYFNLKL